MLFNCLFLFCVGSVFGYVLELLYRKIIRRKWIKPGVFKGFYLPLYGIGLVICYLVYNIDISFVFKVIMLGVLLTFIELMCGLVFIKYFKMPLWDYSDNFCNYRGIICLKFSLYWGGIGTFFLLFVFPIFNFKFFMKGLIILMCFAYLLCIIIDAVITFYKLFQKR